MIVNSIKFYLIVGRIMIREQLIIVSIKEIISGNNMINKNEIISKKIIKNKKMKT